MYQEKHLINFLLKFKIYVENPFKVMTCGKTIPWRIMISLHIKGFKVITLLPQEMFCC